MEELQTTWQKQGTCIVFTYQSSFMNMEKCTYIYNNTRYLLHWALLIDYPQSLQQSAR